MESPPPLASPIDSHNVPSARSEMLSEESIFALDEEVHDIDESSVSGLLPPPPSSQHQHEPSMHDVSLLMRPQDADLLESIHLSLNGCDSPYALQVSTTTTTPRRSDLVSSDSVTSLGDAISKHSHYKSPVREHRKVFLRYDSHHSEDGGEADESTRRALSGEVYNASFSELPKEVTSDPKALPDSREIEKESSSDLHKRTGSFTRRISEAQQFAEAVGDLHPNEQEQLRIIEDDVNDDSDDEFNHKDFVCVQAQLQDAEQTEPSALQPIQTPLAVDIAVRRKSRPSWPFGSATKRGFMDKLPDRGIQQDFVYKGIRANPPNIVKRGTDRGNYAQLHRKAWLEVSDKYHRYGKHLRVYYRHWESLDCPYNMFFDWLDCKGEGAGQPLPNLPECPRSELDADTVLYIANDDVTQGYALSFSSDDQGRGRVFDVDGDPVQTGQDGWIFVLRDNVMYGGQKITSVRGKSKQRFHHSSFFGGKAVAAAGIFVTDDEGYLTRLYPHSGHYRPGDAHMQRMLFFLHHEGVDLRTFEMDIQQIQHVARDTPDTTTVVKADSADKTADKKKKVETLMLVPAVEVACYLAHKARFIGENIFSQIHQIRLSGAATVTEALAAIEEGNGEAGVQLRL